MRSMLYIGWNKDKYIIDISYDPTLDLKFHSRAWGCQQLWILTPSLLLGQAISILQAISSDEEREGVYFNNKEVSKITSLAKYIQKKVPFKLSYGSRLKEKFELVQEELKKMGLASLDEPLLITCTHSLMNNNPIDYKLKEADDLYNLIDGRFILGEEIEQLLLVSGIKFKSPIEDLLQLLYLQKKLDIFPGVGMEKKQRKCFRCGSTDKLRQSYCLDCGSNECYYCENCIAMGEARECKPIYGISSWKRDVGRKVDINFGFELTRVQRDAAINLWQFVKNEQSSSKCLVWAACGAGKTEVAFPAIAEVLSQGYKVLFAIPRKDTVIDLEKRIKKSFSGVKVAALYGGSNEKYNEAHLVLATTHQVLRFYNAFHLVVLDEVDAFPYHGNPMLYHALNRACHPKGKIVYLTATPPKYLLKMGKNKLQRITIPARHHGYPLPVPEIIIDKSLQFKQDELSIPEKVLEFLHESVEGELSQVLVFVPTIFLAERTGAILKKAFELPPFNNFDGSWVNYTHSQDPERDKKRDSFLKGEFPVLVTTTLMERGITVPKVNVIVLFAENQYIFDTATLVQMAGRTGRKAENPHGRVWFVGSHMTSSMKEAVLWINNMNKEAAEKGYLRRLPYPRRFKIKNAT